MQHNWKAYRWAGGYALFCRSCGEKSEDAGFECRGPRALGEKP